MGAIIFETGGLLVDHGWLRILGSGYPRLPRSLMRWPGWQDEMGTVGSDQALSIYPPLWADDPPVGQRSRGPISIAEIYDLHVGRRAD